MVAHWMLSLGALSRDDLALVDWLWARAQLEGLRTLKASQIVFATGRRGPFHVRTPPWRTSSN